MHTALISLVENRSQKGKMKDDRRENWLRNFCGARSPAILLEFYGPFNLFLKLLSKIFQLVLYHHGIISSLFCNQFYIKGTISPALYESSQWNARKAMVQCCQQGRQCKSRWSHMVMDQHAVIHRSRTLNSYE